MGGAPGLPLWLALPSIRLFSSSLSENLELRDVTFLVSEESGFYFLSSFVPQLDKGAHKVLYGEKEGGGVPKIGVIPSSSSSGHGQESKKGCSHETASLLQESSFSPFSQPCGMMIRSTQWAASWWGFPQVKEREGPPEERRKKDKGEKEISVKNIYEVAIFVLFPKELPN